jgi:hypothetical protein
MKITTLITALFISLASFGQGLNGEIALNDEYSQMSMGMTVVDEYSYFIKYQPNGDNYATTYTLNKVDTLENIVWSSLIEPNPSDAMIEFKIIPSENGGIYLSGWGWPSCDVGSECFRFIQKFDANGNLGWTKTWFDEFCYEVIISGLSLNDNNELLFNYKNSTESKIYTMSSGGNLMDSLSVANSELESILEFTNYEKIAYKKDSIFGFDNNGNLTASLRFSTHIQGMKVLNNTLYALTSDSIFSFDTNFQEIEANNLVGYTGYSNLKVDNNQIEFISHGLNDQFIITLDHQFGLIDFLTIPIKLDIATEKDFNDLHFTVSENYELTMFTSIRHLDYSRKSTQDAIINTTDIGVIDIQQTQVSAVSVQGTEGVFEIKLWADVMIKNFGNNTLDDCRINHYIAQGFCGSAVYSEQFSNLNLAPNDSMWISLGLIHTNTNYFSDSLISAGICVYTSHSNFKTDMNITNDNYCKNIVFGYLGLEENEINEVNIYPNPTSSILNIEIEKDDLQYVIYNTQGLLINKGNVESKQIDVSKLSSGMYVLQLNSKDGDLIHRKQFLVKD